MSLVMKGSKNLFDINGGYSANSVSYEKYIKVENDKLISEYVVGGSSSFVTFEQVFPAGTYTICMNILTNDTSSGKSLYRFATSVENNVGTYNSYFNAWVKEAEKNSPITFITTEPFKLSLIFIGNDGSQRTYYDIMLNEGVSALDYQPFGKSLIKVVYKGKNLLFLNRNVAPFDGDGSNTAIRNFSENYCYVSMAANNYWGTWAMKQYSIFGNNVVVETSTLGYGIVFPIRCKPNVKYKFSYTGENATYAIGFYTASGEFIRFVEEAYINSHGGYIEPPENCYWFTICLKVKDVNIVATFTNIMLNEGKTALPYEPYLIKYKAFVKGDI